jgi:hypothetical protein
MLVTGLTLKNGRLVEAKTRSKFNVKHDDPRRIFQGVKYDSAAEARFAAELVVRKQAGEITSIARQCDIELVVKGKLVCKLRLTSMWCIPMAGASTSRSRALRRTSGA